MLQKKKDFTVLRMPDKIIKKFYFIVLNVAFLIFEILFWHIQEVYNCKMYVFKFVAIKIAIRYYLIMVQLI